MTFPVQSSEKLSLIPVIAMLLQFNGEELREVEKVNKDPVWGSLPVKEVKRVTSYVGARSLTAKSQTLNRQTIAQSSPNLHRNTISTDSSIKQGIASKNEGKYRPPTVMKSEVGKSGSDPDFNEKLQKLSSSEVLDIQSSFDEVDLHTFSSESAAGLQFDVNHGESQSV